MRVGVPWEGRAHAVRDDETQGMIPRGGKKEHNLWRHGPRTRLRGYTCHERLKRRHKYNQSSITLAPPMVLTTIPQRPKMTGFRLPIYARPV